MKKDNKTIGITLRLWTNDLKVVHPSTGEASSLACWDSGTLGLEMNKEKGIESNMVIVQCYEDIIPGIKELLRKAKILAVSSNNRPRILSHRRKE